MTVGSDAPQSLSLLSPAGQQPEQPLFLFLPGMDGTGRLLRTQLHTLKHRVDIRCARLPTQIGQSWQSLVEQTIQSIHTEHKQFGQRPVYLCGESFGACLALQVIAWAPELVKRLILVNPATAFRSLMWSNWAASSLKLLPNLSYPLACSLLLPFLANLSRVNPHDSHALLTAMQSVGTPLAAQRIELLSQFELPDGILGQITTPTLLIASGGDRLLPSVKEAERLSSMLPQVQVHRLPNSGHTCLLERDVNLGGIMARYQFGITSAAQPSRQ